MISKNQIKFIRQLEQKKFRHREGLFVAEGTKVVGDLLKAGYIPHSLYATPDWIASHSVAEATEVTDDELTRLSFQQHPQQALALFPIPEPADLSPLISHFSWMASKTPATSAPSSA